MYADDTSIVIFDKDLEKFELKITTTFDRMNKWFQLNLLSLNFGKTKFLQFLTKNSHEIDTQVSYKHSKIDNTQFTAVPFSAGKRFIKKHLELTHEAKWAAGSPNC
jgi:hypothetical protein